MFSTVAAAEMKLPAPVTQAGSMYWLAVSIETLTPWYLVTYRAGEGDESQIGTMCIAWETSLLDILKSACVEAMYCLVPSYDRVGEWRMTEVLEVREPSKKNESHGPMLFQFAGSGATVDARQESITHDVFQGGVTLFRRRP